MSSNRNNPLQKRLFLTQTNPFVVYLLYFLLLDAVSCF